MLWAIKTQTIRSFRASLKKIIPDAKFICINRDYRDNYLSVKKTGLLHGILPWIIFRWKDSMKKVQELVKKYPEQFYSLRYEDFIDKPDFYLEEICNFIGVPVSHEMIANYQDNNKTSNMYREKKSEVFHSKIYQPVDPNNKEKWKNELNDDEVMLMDRLAGKTAELAGYERKFTKYPLRVHIHAIKRILVIRLYLGFKAVLRF
ncbi:sulfotransferase, partial [Candidatus Venteria ishoeyi]|uniref:sulfotransferase n=1 Tax=Candidatus Venteria ishoeyi TaxID=1899563 RepID=UPI0015B29BE4